MSVSVNCNQPTVVTNKPAFKGSYKQTEKGNPYYHTNSAMKIGGAMAGLSAIGTAIRLTNDKMVTDTFNAAQKDMPADIKSKLGELKGNKTTIIAGGLIGIAIHLGIAALIDHKRNQKAKETADFAKQVGTKNAVMNGDNVAISNKGRAYYDSNVGSKLGGWLGAGFGVYASIKSYLKQKKIYDTIAKEAGKDGKILKQAGKVGGVIGAVIATGMAALGGWLLGMWSDNIANNDARKHA